MNIIIKCLFPLSLLICFNSFAQPPDSTQLSFDSVVAEKIPEVTVERNWLYGNNLVAVGVNSKEYNPERKEVTNQAPISFTSGVPDLDALNAFRKISTEPGCSL